jgi:hypothetical protein
MLFLIDSGNLSAIERCTEFFPLTELHKPHVIAKEKVISKSF